MFHNPYKSMLIHSSVWKYPFIPFALMTSSKHEQKLPESCDQHGCSRPSRSEIGQVKSIVKLSTKSIDKTAKSIIAFDSIDYGVYGLVQIHPDQPPIRFRDWIGSISNLKLSNFVLSYFRLPIWSYHYPKIIESKQISRIVTFIGCNVCVKSG